MAFVNKGFDVKIFIEEIQRRPALWDTSTKDYKNRDTRRDAWIELLEMFTANFEERSSEDKQKLGKELQQKWKYIRDAYIRQIRIRNERQRQDKSADIKTYIYAKELSFLNKNFTNNGECFLNISDDDEILNDPKRKSKNSPSIISVIKKRKSSESQQNTKIINHRDYPKISSKNYNSPMAKVIRRRRRKRYEDQQLEIQNHEENNTKTLDNVTEKRNENDESDDMAFFRSLLPCLAELRPVQKLPFRIEVMKLLHQYTQDNSHEISSIGQIYETQQDQSMISLTEDENNTRITASPERECKIECTTFIG